MLGESKRNLVPLCKLLHEMLKICVTFANDGVMCDDDDEGFLATTTK